MSRTILGILVLFGFSPLFLIMIETTIFGK